MSRAAEKDDKASNPFEFSTNDVCELFDVSRDTLAAWAKKGAPKEGRGCWDIRKLIKWRYNDKTDSPEARKTQADATFRETKARKEKIALDMLEGKLIEREEVDRQWTTVGVMIKNNLLLWAKSLAPHLAHQEVRDVEAKLSESVYDLLDQLSKTSRYRAKKK